MNFVNDEATVENMTPPDPNVLPCRTTKLMLRFWSLSNKNKVVICLNDSAT